MDHQRPATQTLDQPSEAQTVECDAAEPAPESAGIRLGSRRYRPRAVSVVGARLQTRKRRRGRWRLLLPALVLALAIALAACGSSKSSSSSSSSVSAPVSSSATSIKLAKTKFALHAGLAFGAFHRWIYKPVKAGTLTHPLSHKVTLVKAGLAAAFVYHELGLALKDAQADPTLSKVVAPVTALQAKLRGMPNTLKSGTTNPADVTDSNDLISSISQQSSSAGQPISEQIPTSLSTAGTT
jgi:hypothetical protein